MPPKFPSQKEPRDPDAKTWTWKSGIGNTATHNILHLEKGFLYCRTGIAWMSDRDELIEAVKLSHPMDSLDPANVLHVDNIRELRYARDLYFLEIVHGERSKFPILGCHFGGEAFAAIRSSITNKYRIDQEDATLLDAIKAPLLALLFTSVFGSLGSAYLWYQPNILEFIKVAVPAVTLVLSLAFVGMLVFRILKRPKMDILRIIDK